MAKLHPMQKAFRFVEDRAPQCGLGPPGRSCSAGCALSGVTPKPTRDEALRPLRLVAVRYSSISALRRL